MTEKRTRQGRATRQQIDALVSYLEQHPNMASGKFTLMNHEKLQGSWEDLTKYLNSLVPKGKQKDVKSWKTTWRDHKSKVSEKIHKLRNAKTTTGNNPEDIKLSDLDKRILSIIGYEYVQDFEDIPDSFPEKHNVCKKFRVQETFESIADKHTEAMKMLAEAIQLQAEATLKISDAVEKMAKNEENQIKSLEILCKILKDKNT